MTAAISGPTSGTLVKWWTVQVEGYLRLRRSLGFGLVWGELLLRKFTADLTQKGVTVLTVADAVAWALALPAGQTDRPVSRATVRLTANRGFATYLHALDPARRFRPVTCSAGARLLPTCSNSTLNGPEWSRFVSANRPFSAFVAATDRDLGIPQALRR